MVWSKVNFIKNLIIDEFERTSVWSEANLTELGSDQDHFERKVVWSWPLSTQNVLIISKRWIFNFTVNSAVKLCNLISPPPDDNSFSSHSPPDLYNFTAFTAYHSNFLHSQFTVYLEYFALNGGDTSTRAISINITDYHRQNCSQTTTELVLRMLAWAGRG